MTKQHFLVLFVLLLIGCSSPGQSQTALPTATISATPLPTPTTTPTPTAQPTPVGGSGRILMVVGSNLYAETHPELGEGDHLFVYDFSTNSLAPVAHPADKFITTHDASPNGRYLPYMLHESGLAETDALYLLDTSSLESILIMEGYLNYGDLTWLSEESFFFTVQDETFYSVGGYYYEIDSDQPERITPEGRHIYLKGADSQQDIIFIESESYEGIDVLDVDGNISELDLPVVWINILGMTPDGEWLVVRENRQGLALISLDGMVTISVTEALEEVRSNPRSLPQQINWSPDGRFAVVKVPGVGHVLDDMHWETYIWDIEENILTNLSDHIPHKLGSSSTGVWIPPKNQVWISTRWWDNSGNVVDGGVDYLFSLESMSVVLEIPNDQRGNCLMASGDRYSICLMVSPDGNLAFSANTEGERVLVSLDDFSFTLLNFPSSWIVEARTDLLGLIAVMWIE